MELFASICTYFVFSRKVEYAARVRRAGVHWEYIRLCGFFYRGVMSDRRTELRRMIDDLSIDSAAVATYYTSST